MSIPNFLDITGRLIAQNDIADPYTRSIYHTDLNIVPVVPFDPDCSALELSFYNPAPVAKIIPGVLLKNFAVSIDRSTRLDAHVHYNSLQFFQELNKLPVLRGKHLCTFESESRILIQYEVKNLELEIGKICDKYLLVSPQFSDVITFELGRGEGTLKNLTAVFSPRKFRFEFAKRAPAELRPNLLDGTDLEDEPFDLNRDIKMC
jgi:hypothetical protein